MVKEFKINSYRNKTSLAKNETVDNTTLDFDEAFEFIVEYIKQYYKEKEKNNENKKEEKNTKEYFRKVFEEIQQVVAEYMWYNYISVRGYPGDDILSFVKEVTHEIVGYSILSDAFEDIEVSDIYCVSWDKIYIEKNGKNVLYHKKFKTKKHFERTIERFLKECGQEINTGDKKIVDFELYQDRGCAICDAVSTKGYSLTIRKHREEHITLQNLIKWDCMNVDMAELVGLLVDGESNLICAGITGSGKTTTVRALIDFYVTKNEKRMIVCEETQELFPKNDHTIELVSFLNENKEVEITLNKLILTSLRLKPKYIVVGEVRGIEALSAVEGMETGHSTIFTMHGGTPINIINRLITKYMSAMPSLGIEVVERIIGTSVDYILVQDDIPDIGRKISNISEVSYDFENSQIKIKTIYKFDFERKDFVLKSRICPEKANFLMRRGVDIRALKKWVSTNDQETEKAWLDEFNSKYEQTKEDTKKAWIEKHVVQENNKDSQKNKECISGYLEKLLERNKEQENASGNMLIDEND